MKKYISPNFDVIIYEIEDVITLSIGTSDPDTDSGNGDNWWG